MQAARLLAAFTPRVVNLKGNSTPAVADNATIWGYNTAGNNGYVRITSAADTVVLAFPNDIAANDSQA